MELRQIGTALAEIQRGGKICIISDRNVASLYMDSCRESLEEAGYGVWEYVLPPGEASKNGTNYLRILEYLAAVPFTRSDGIVALGGGMVGDLAGFTAATYMRGINVYQVPTTLLAAVDSSVGGKTAIVSSAETGFTGQSPLEHLAVGRLPGGYGGSHQIRDDSRSKAVQKAGESDGGSKFVRRGD